VRIIELNDLNGVGLKSIGYQIKQLRKQKGWTQQMLADLSGLDRTTIGALERDDYSDIGIRKVQRVLQLLGKSLTLTTVGLPTLDELKKVAHMTTERAGGKS